MHTHCAIVDFLLLVLYFVTQDVTNGGKGAKARWDFSMQFLQLPVHLQLFRSYTNIKAMILLLFSSKSATIICCLQQWFYNFSYLSVISC